MSHPTRNNRLARLWGLGIGFLLICLVYIIRLSTLQLTSENIGGHKQDGTTERRVTVQAVRGQIYDRNGTPLVTNTYTYSLTVDYAVLPTENNERNAILLSVLHILESCGDTGHFETNRFPFDGYYPNYTYSADVADTETGTHAKFLSVVENNGLRREAVLRIKEEKHMNASEANAYYDAHPLESIPAERLVRYFIRAYGLDATDDSGGTPLYSYADIDRLFRILWGMEATGFSRVNDYTLASGISMDTVTRALEPGLAGIGFATSATRVYNYPGRASHILGQTGPIYREEWEHYKELGYDMNAIVGKSGCEAAFEEYLRGRDGVKVIVENEDGVIVDEYMKVEPIAGQDVYLTIDIDLQIAAEEALRDNILAIQADYNREDCRTGAIVAMDPRSGELLALASYPTYDLVTFNRDYNTLAADETQPLLNRALLGIYAPGSTFKPLMAVAALNEGIVEPSTLLECAGTYTYYQSYQPDCWIHNSSSAVKKHGWLNAADALMVSCNCYFFEAGRLLGIERMNRYSAWAGFGQPTGIELGETAGILAGPANRDATGGMEWQSTDTIAAAIGQSDNAFTPLQICVATSTIVNGGNRYAAHLLLRVRDFATREDTYTSTPTVLATLPMPDSTLATIRSGMEAVITSSSQISRYMRNIPVRVAGKTGTAQTGNTVDNGLFVCCAPSQNPEIVVTSVIERAGGGSYSAPSAARVLEAYYEGRE